MPSKIAKSREIPIKFDLKVINLDSWCQSKAFESLSVVPETEINANQFFTHIHTFQTFMFYALVINSS